MTRGKKGNYVKKKSSPKLSLLNRECQILAYTCNSCIWLSNFDKALKTPILTTPNTNYGKKKTLNCSNRI